MMRRLLIGALLLLSACASQAPLPAKTPALALPLQLHVQRLEAGQSQDWLLVIQREGGGIRWSMMDPLGIPQARQKLIDGQWQADGLLPPNPQARELFAALLFALASADDVRALYPDERLPGLTERTIVTRSALEAELDRVRARGYALNDGESDEHIRSAAAVVRDGSGVARFAISASAPAFRADEAALSALAEAVSAACARATPPHGSARRAR